MDRRRVWFAITPLVVACASDTAPTSADTTGTSTGADTSGAEQPDDGSDTSSDEGDGGTTDAAATGTTESDTTGDPAGSSSSGGSPSCGDGVVDGDEQCDLGDANADDGACTLACTNAACGDALVGPGEQCDEGAANAEGATCLPTCMTASCGDGFVHRGVEQCDEGAANADDAPCSTSCTNATCGDGFVWVGVEECDEGAANADDGACLTTCVSATCGDGFVQAGVEECDEALANNYGGGCLPTCVAATCGDDYIWADVEECDDGPSNGPNGACLPDCVTATCGDALVWNGFEECDEGDANANDAACLASCVVASCGDTFVLSDVETCDDGNAVESDGCRSDCTEVSDFVLAYIAGEEAVGPGGLGGNVGLRSRASRVEILENNDFIVFGEEQYNAGGQAGIRWGAALWRFSGATGELMWRHVDGYLQRVKLGFLGIGSDDGSYVAMQTQMPYTPAVRKFDAEGNIEWTTSDVLRDQLRAAFIAVDFTNTWVDGGAVTQADEVVLAVGVSTPSDAAYTFFAAYASENEQLFISSVPDVLGPLPLVEREPGSLVTIASDMQLQTSTGGDRIAIVQLSMADGSITSTPLDLTAYEAGPIGASAYEPGWSPVDFVAPADTTDIWFVANEYYWDNGTAPKVHLFHVSEDGEVLGHVLGDLEEYGGLVNLYQYRALAETPEGLVVAGTWTDRNNGPAWDWPIAPRHGRDLVRLGDFVAPELANNEAEWFDVATRNGRTVFVGTIEGLTMLIASTEIGG